MYINSTATHNRCFQLTDRSAKSTPATQMTISRRQESLRSRITGGALGILQFLLPMTVAAFDKGQERYWRALPARRMIGVLLGLFFTVGGVAFFIDLVNWRRMPLNLVLMSAALFGVTGVVLFLATHARYFWFIPVPLALIGANVYTMGFIPHGPQVPISEVARRRIVLDASGILVGLLFDDGLAFGLENIEHLTVENSQQSLEKLPKKFWLKPGGLVLEQMTKPCFLYEP
jgi:hypothetical protein